VSPQEAARDYMRRHASAASRSIAELVQELVAVKVGLGRDPDYLRNLRQQLDRFSAAFQCPLDRVQAPDLQRWLKEISGAARTRANYFGAVRDLVKFAKGERELPADWDELDRLRLPTAGPGKIQPYSPEEMGRILAHAEDRAPAWVPYLAVRAFSGIRFKEALRIGAASFNLRSRLIALDAEITKTHQRRLVPISANLLAWLRRYPPGDSLAPSSPAAMGKDLVRLIRAARVSNRRNGLRYSFASYRMALVAYAAQVAQECGHSPAILARSYREIRLPDGRMITPGLARRWFGICRETVGKEVLRVNFLGK
jgi:integrase